MKNQELQSSLIKSGIFLVLCIFFIYAFAVDDSGGVVGTISSLFSGIIFLIGLSFALAFSILVLVGIYFGILAMYGGDTCKNTFGELKSSLANSTNCITKHLSTGCCSPKPSPTSLNDNTIDLLREDQKVINNQVTDLKNSVTSFETSISTLSSTMTNIVEDIAALNEKVESVALKLEEKATVASVEDSVKKLSDELNSTQSSLTPVNNKLLELEKSLSSFATENSNDEVTAVHELVTQTVSGLKDEISTIKASVDALLEGDENTETSTDILDTEKHRILSYFTNDNDKKEFIALVEEAVGKEMTYAQIGEFLDDSLSEEAAVVIADHPSLTKDYIRECRQTS